MIERWFPVDQGKGGRGRGDFISNSTAKVEEDDMFITEFVDR